MQTAYFLAIICIEIEKGNEMNKWLEKNRLLIIGMCLGTVIPTLINVYILRDTGQSMADISTLLQECKQTQTNCKIIVKGIK